MSRCQTKRRALSLLARSFVLVVTTWTCSGCASLLSNTALISDSSHLGTPYSGSRRDLHTLYCLGRDVGREPATLLFFPVALVPLIDLPLSLAMDTLLLPIDLVVEPDARPLVIGSGGCRLIGM